jgi:protein tyrosine phosphatase (PTP) superfamily phosphohydrolase (DUF442 family)
MTDAPAAPAPTNRRRLVLWSLVALVVAGAGVGTWLVLKPPFYHWVEVVPGKVYRSGLLEDDLGKAIDRYGLKTVINLRSVAERAQGTWYEDEKRTTAEKGVRLVDLPMSGGTAPSPEQVDVLLSIFDDPKTQPLLLHCRHGVTRSAGVEALYRREMLGETADQALAHVSEQKPDLVSKYPAIAEFVRSYVPRKDRPAPPK